MKTAISSSQIQSFCRPFAYPVQIEIVAETTSTNSDLLNRIDSLTAPTLLLALRQTAGRGRAGRVWHAAPDATLTFSLAWKFALPMHALTGLPLAVGVAMAQALAALNVQAELKWPNDILRNGKKLGGILIETATDKKSSEDTTWSIIGIGLNVALPPALVDQLGPAMAIDSGLENLDRNLLIATLLSTLVETLLEFEREGFAAFMSRWNAFHAYAHQTVTILDHGKLLHEGKALGVDASGRLLLDTSKGVIAIMAGDVSLRVKEDLPLHF